jgi:hypothetical protein
MSKNIGRRASAQDNFTGPSPVTNVTAQDYLNGVNNERPYNNGAITVSWSAPAAGNTPVGYKVYEDGVLRATVPFGTNTTLITGLGSNTSHTYAVSSYDLYLDNSSNAVAAPAAIATTVPQAPNTPTATAGVDLDTINWVLNANGGKTVIDIFIQSNETTPKTKTVTTASNGSTTIANEANTAQAYRVRARNGNGSSDYSAFSNSVTTLPPSFFSPPFFPPGFFSPPFFPPGFFSPPFFPPGFFSPPFFPPGFFSPPFFPPVFFAPPFFPPGFFSPPFFPPGFFSPPFFPPGFFSPPGFGGGQFDLRSY